MDLNVIKERLASLNTQQPQSGGGQRKTYFGNLALVNKQLELYLLNLDLNFHLRK